MMRLRCGWIAAGCLLLGACVGSPPSTAELTARMLEAMGGRAVLQGAATLVLHGGGTRTRMGQIAVTGGEDPTGRLDRMTETIDLADGRAAFDYDIVNGDFTQHRTEVYTRYRDEPVGWGTTAGRPNVATSPNGLFSWATQNSPDMLLRRNVVTVALGAAATASPEQTAETRVFAGRETYYGSVRLPDGERIGLYFDPDTSLLAGFTALDTETMLGDVDAVYTFADYRAVGDLVLPHSLTIEKQGRPYAAIEYSDISINGTDALEVFSIPDDIVDQADAVIAADGPWVPLTWAPVAPGVYQAVAFSHHSMVVEFPSFVVVVEGPYTEAQALTLARRIEVELGKPIRYVVPSHPHYDHTGGIRALASVGANVLVARGHEAELRGIVGSPHTNPPDALARRAAAGAEVGTIEVFTAMTTIEQGAQSLELYEVTTIPHVVPKVLAYVPSSGALFQSDLFFGAPGPDATALYDAIAERGLDVEHIVGGHGGLLSFSALEQAAHAAGGE